MDKPINVEWVVNDHAELGVKIDEQFFWLYKGEILIIKDGLHDDGTPMLYRLVEKREFGECCHPIHLETLPERYTEGEGWKPIKSKSQDLTPKDDIAPHWFIDYTHGHAEYVGHDVEDYARSLAQVLNCQVEIYRMDYSFSVKAPNMSQINHEEALVLAHLKKETSNLARCYIDICDKIPRTHLARPKPVPREGLTLNEGLFPNKHP